MAGRFASYLSWSTTANRMTPFLVGVGPATNTITSSCVERLETPTPSTQVPFILLTVSFFVRSTHFSPWIDEYSSLSSLVSAALTSGESATQNTSATSPFGDAARISSSLASTDHFFGMSIETFAALLL